MTIDELFAAHWRSSEPCIICETTPAFENYSSKPMCRAGVIRTGVVIGLIAQGDADAELVNWPSCEPPKQKDWRQD